MNYEWRRFWCPRGGTILLDLNGYVADPEVHRWAHAAAGVVEFAQMDAARCLVLLGEPGIGKSTAVRDAFELTRVEAAARGDLAIHFDLRSYGDESRLVRDLFESAEVLAWRSGSDTLHLFIDSLDECLLRIATVAAIFLDKLAPLPRDRLRLRVACRTGDWPKLLEDGLPGLWGKEQVHVAELAPLRRRDVVIAAQQNGIDAEQFLQQVEERGAVPLALKPITLEFLLGSYRSCGTLPNTQVQLYQDGCLRLCEEQSPSRTAGNERGNIEPSQRLAVAARIAAVMMLCQRGSVWTESENGTMATDELALRDLVGQTEVADGIAFRVSESAVRETLASTGLFSSRGPGRIGWAHQTYAEYLAARFMVDHGFSAPQVKALLMHHEDQSQVIPQLHETAAWFANLDVNGFRWLAETDPQVLLKSDVAPSDADRRALSQKLLEGFDAGRLLDDDWGLYDQYRKLRHPTLSQHLSPYISDKTKNVVVRRVAIDIAAACELLELQDTLVDVALDATEDIDTVRVHAAYAIKRMSDPARRFRLLPLALGAAGPDPNDELKAIALQTLCPEVISASSAFFLLTPPKNKAFFGAYSGFIHHLGRLITPADLPMALQWVVSQPSRHMMDIPEQDLLDAIMRLGWEQARDSEIAMLMAAAVQSRLVHYDQLLVDERDELEAKRHRFELSVETRRLVLDALIAVVAPAKDIAGRVMFSHPPLLVQTDLAWVVSRFDATTSTTRETWAAVIAFLFERESTAAALDLVLTAVEKNPDLAVALAAYIQPIDIDSERARDLKETAARIHKMQMEDNRPKLIEPSPAERVATRLGQFESGEKLAWCNLTRELELEPTSSQYGNRWQPDLTALPGWKAADESIRRRIVDVAKRFVLTADPENAEWLGTNSYRHVALDGYRALRLVSLIDPAWISELSAAAWQRWAPIIVAYPRTHAQAVQVDHDLVSRAYGVCPADVVFTVSTLVDAEDTPGNYLSCHRTVDHCWDARLADALLAKAVDPARSPSAAADLLGQGMQKGDHRFAVQAIALVATLAPSDREKAVVLAASVFVHAPDVGWATIAAALERDSAFGADVVTKVATRIQRDVAPIATRLSAAQIADLFIWMERQFPRSDDPERTSSLVSGRDSVGWFRDGLLRHMQNSGDPGTLAAINRIAEALPHLPWLALTRVLARRATLRKTWLPPAPEQLLHLSQNTDARLVESGEQLLDAISESLDRLENAFQGETPEARDVWDNRGVSGWFPNDENSFSDHVKRHLERDLKKRGIVLNREVEIRQSVGRGSGERTDIHVDAIRRLPSGAHDVVKVIIETKGCWHTEVLTAMETQLRDRYLRGNDCRHGLYLVGWFSSPRWSVKDDRRKAVPWASLEMARAELAQQAAALSNSEVTVRAYVVDASLR